MNFNGQEGDFLKIEYKQKDTLYVPAYKLSLIQKYRGTKSQFLIQKLGDKSFLKTKSKVKKNLQSLCAELLNLYAKRMALKREPLALNKADLDSFCSDFPFEETRDQKKAVEEIFKDCLEKTTPMNRLLCGDVGFGKTEVALRACFLFLNSGKQVCFVAPTTFLNFQHFQNFKKRLKKFPFEIEMINRFTKAKKLKGSFKKIKKWANRYDYRNSQTFKSRCRV